MNDLLMTLLHNYDDFFRLTTTIFIKKETSNVKPPANHRNRNAPRNHPRLVIALVLPYRAMRTLTAFSAFCVLFIINECCNKNNLI
jgi:hypothetical protein